MTSAEVARPARPNSALNDLRFRSEDNCSSESTHQSFYKHCRLVVHLLYCEFWVTKWHSFQDPQADFFLNSGWLERNFGWNSADCQHFFWNTAEVLQSRKEMSVNNSHEQSRQEFYSLHKTHRLLLVLHNSRILLHHNFTAYATVNL